MQASSFSASLDALSRRLGRSGYHTTREPIDTSLISSSMIDCEVIARNDEYRILYMEAESNWRGIARSVAESQNAPCLVATKYGDAMIMTTIRDKMTRSPRPRHIVISPDSEKYGLSEFVKKIRATDEDDFLSIDEKVQKAFDVFSKYDEALKKFGENLDDVIKDTKKKIQSRAQKSKKYLAESEKFAAVCREILNDTIQQQDVTGMLIQHVITARIFAAVYDYDFVKTNSIARELERLCEILDIPDDLIDYSDILLVAESITNDEERQQFIRQIYETFYKKYDPKRANRDGIVYTPVEIVDFILTSVQHVLQSEFNTDFSDRSVKVLDPFTGTGTFLARLLASGMLGDNTTAKYKEDMFANELLLLAFYIATVNMESTYASTTDANKEYVPFEGMNYTDTFMMNPRYLEDKRHRQEETKIDQKVLDIRKRRQRQRKTNLHIIVANPPYSAGQSNYNDQNQNLPYSVVDERIKTTYIKKVHDVNSTITNLNSLYDSYIRSIRWASDRIGESGIIGFVTNASFVRSEAAAGVRACLQEEFTDVWVFDLRGNARTQGEERKKEAGTVFGGGSRAPVAITILVKNPKKTGPATIRYHDIGDYHDRESKLDIIKTADSIKGIKDWQIIQPDRHHDWLDQRTDKFSEYLPIGSKDARAGKRNAVFGIYSSGVKTGRDAWACNSSKDALMKNMKGHINYCNSQDPTNPIIDPKKAKYDRESTKYLKKLGRQKFTKNKIRSVLYRPFFKQYLYFDKVFNQMRYQVPNFFPKNNTENLTIVIPYHTNTKFSTIITDVTPDIQVDKNGQCFPLRTKKINDTHTHTQHFKSVHNSTVQDTARRIFSVHSKHDTGLGGDPPRASVSDEGDEEMMVGNITDYALEEYRAHYGDDTISKESIFYYTYGLLHHPTYRKKYANNLTRELPHIPMAPDFWTFSKLGKDLADLHLSYETCKRYDLGRPKNQIPDSPRRIRWGRQKKDPDKGITSSQNQHVMIIDDVIVYENLPVCEYRVNGRTPLGWFVDRYGHTIDKESGIENWPLEGVSGEDVRAVIERLAHVGAESDRLVSRLPEEFEPGEGWKPSKRGIMEQIQDASR